MLLASGIAALVGIALVGAQRQFLEVPSAIRSSAAQKHTARTARNSSSILLGEPSHQAKVIPGMYLVEFADGHDNATFFASLHASGVQTVPRMNLDFTLFKGASFRINDDVVQEHTQVSMISAMPAVKQMWPLRNYSIPNTQRKNFMMNPNATITILEDLPSTNVSSDAAAKKKDIFSTHAMTGVDKLHAEGTTGQGIRIGIVDTGVDYTNPALGGCFGKHCLVSYGYDLVGDDWDGWNSPKPDGDPFDNCQGHGTHVSGIIAAQPNNLKFTGVAPGATLGMYRVFSCASLGTSDDVLIAAFNMAFEEGSDIITSSIGGEIGWSEVPWSVAVSRIVAEGVPCTLAAGNAGYYGLFTSSNAADGVGVTAVASFDNVVTPNLLPKAFYRTSAKGSQTADIDAHEEVAFGWEPSYPFFHNVSLPLIALSNNSKVNADACTKLPEHTPDLSKYAVLIRLGGCDPTVKAKNAIAKGASNLVFYATENSSLPKFELYGPFSLKKPLNGTGTVTASQGATWVELLNSGKKIRLTFTEPETADVAYLEFPNALTGGFASSFTSWGPTWDLAVYPSVGAPGGNILSTYPMNMGGYAIDSGTSMATPFTAGVLALLIQGRKSKLTPGELTSLIASTAKANFWNDGGGSLRDLAPVPQQGPGLIQAYDAAHTTTLVSKASISFNDTDHIPDAVEFVLSNNGDDTITYQLGHVPALGMYMFSIDRESYTYDPAFFPNPIFAASAQLNFTNTTFNLQPKARVFVSVTASPPTNEEGALSAALLPVYSGFISINGSDGSNLTIPYMGVAGSLYNAENLDEARSTNLGCSTGYSSYQEAYCTYNNASFTLPYPTDQLSEIDSFGWPIQYPAVSFILSLASPLVRVDVLPLSHNFSGPVTSVLGVKTAGSIYGWPQTYLDRTNFEVGFNGMLADGSVVPEGVYGLYVRVLKLFGDPEKEHDYSVVVMVPFSLHYDNSTVSPDTGFPPDHRVLPQLS